jgi:nitrous oxidase accessory protein NosD
MTVRDNTLREGVVVGMGAGGLLEDNVILDLPVDILERSSLEVRGNTFRPEPGAPAIWIDWSGASATIVGNVIDGAGQGIHVDHASSVLIEGNTITAPESGVVVTETEAVIRDNVVTDASDVGILVSGNGITAEGNTVSGGRVGVIASIPNGYPPDAPRFDAPARIEDNEITGASHFGLLVNEAAPVVTGNTICAEREPVRLENDASPQLGTNEICGVPG